MVAVLAEYGLLLAHIHTDGLLVLLVFHHLCQAFVGILPSMALFRHYFFPRPMNRDLTGGLVFVLRSTDEYISMEGMKSTAEWCHKWS
jgi:hypothetical protein